MIFIFVCAALVSFSSLRKLQLEYLIYKSTIPDFSHTGIDLKIRGFGVFAFLLIGFLTSLLAIFYFKNISFDLTSNFAPVLLVFFALLTVVYYFSRKVRESHIRNQIKGDFLCFSLICLMNLRLGEPVYCFLKNLIQDEIYVSSHLAERLTWLLKNLEKRSDSESVYKELFSKLPSDDFVDLFRILKQNAETGIQNDDQVETLIRMHNERALSELERSKGKFQLLLTFCVAIFLMPPFIAILLGPIFLN
ncbi:MAG: type II secretion system F family protein [Geminicoccaceae bacterium]